MNFIALASMTRTTKSEHGRRATKSEQGRRVTWSKKKRKMTKKKHHEWAGKRSDQEQTSRAPGTKKMTKKRSKERKEEHRSKRIDYELGTTYLSMWWWAWGACMVPNCGLWLFLLHFLSSGDGNGDSKTLEECGGGDGVRQNFWSAIELRRMWWSFYSSRKALKPGRGFGFGFRVWVGSWGWIGSWEGIGIWVILRTNCGRSGVWGNKKKKNRNPPQRTVRGGWVSSYPKKSKAWIFGWCTGGWCVTKNILGP